MDVDLSVILSHFDIVSRSDQTAEASNHSSGELFQWMDRPTSLYEGSVLLLMEGSDKMKKGILYFLYNNVYSKWAEMSPELHVETRNNLLKFAFEMNGNPELLDGSVKPLAAVAVFSILDEWPDFWNFCFFSEEEPPMVRAAKLNLATLFYKEMETCKFLSPNTRMKIKELCFEITEPLFNCTMIGFQDVNTVPYALLALNIVMTWGELPQILSDGMMQSLCTQYICDAATQEQAVECLTTIFIKRTDCVDSFRHYSALVVHSLYESKDPINPALPVTNGKTVLEFLMKFLSRFLFLIETIFFPIPEDIDNDAKAQMSEEYEMIMSGFAVYGYSKELFAVELNTLYRIVLSITPDCISPSFWKLWNDIIRKMYFEKMSSQGSHPIYEFFSELIPYIREQLFILLPCAVDDGSCTFDSRSCWSMLFQIDVESMIAFINEKEVSQSLFYVIGCFDLAIDDESTTGDVFRIVNDAIEEVTTETDADIIKALLFATSHSTKYITENHEAFEKVVSFVLQCLGNESEGISTEASHAIFCLTQRHIGQFIRNDMEYARIVISNSELFVMLPKDVRVRMFKVCTQLISNAENPQVIAEAFNDLFAPIQSSLSIFYQDREDYNNMKNAIDALDIVSECAGILTKNGNILCELFVPMLLELGPEIYGNDNFFELSHSILCALGFLMSKASFTEIQESLVMTLDQLVGKRESVTSVFTFLKIIRSKIEEIDTLFPNIQNTFINIALEQPDPPLEDILSMLSVFGLAVLDVESVLDLVMRGVQDLSHEVNYAAIDCWMNMLKPSPSLQHILLSTSERIFQVTFCALTDMLHGNSFDRIVDFLRQLFSLLENQKLSSPDLLGMLVNLLTGILGQEPRQGMYNDFVSYLKATANSPNKFSRGINDMLSSLHKLSPVDTDLFKIEEFSHFSFIPFQRDKISDKLKNLLASEDHVLTPVKAVLSAKKSFKFSKCKK